MNDSLFDELTTAVTRRGVAAGLEWLAERLRDAGRLHELFDVRLMIGRRRLGLPAVSTAPLDELPEPRRTELEEVYLAACREVGGLLLNAGKIAEAWMYLRPVGDKASVAAALAQAEPDDEQIETYIGLAVQEGVAPRRGFEWVLKRYGTCNAITMFEQALHDRPPADRRAVAALLVGHLHGELLESLRHDITRQAGEPPAESSIAGLVADRDWLFGEYAYHIDTTHLASVTRFALVLEDPESLRLAVDLTEYGRRLSRQFQYAGEEPFRDAYPAYALFFQAQLGAKVDEAVAYFRERAEQVDAAEQGTAAIEVYLVLLQRLGRYVEAVEAAARLIPAGARLSGFAPTLLELSRRAGQFERLLETTRARDDVVGFAAGLAERSAAEASGPRVDG